MKKDWKIDILKNLCDVFNDGDWIESKDQSQFGIRLIQTGNIGFGFFKDKEDKSRYISEETFKRLKCTEIFPGDLLVSRLPDPVGKSCIIPDLNIRMITGVDCTIVRPNNNLKSEFLKYYQMSDSYLNDVKERVTGTTRSRISRKNLGMIEIPIPPLEEQQKIVEKLDKAFELIDQAKANIEQNIINAKELFQSKLDEVFSVKNGNVFKLGDLGKITSSKRIYKNEYVNEGIPFYRTKEIKELANSEEISLELFISREKYYEIKSKFGVPQIGDILISAVGTIGEIYVIDDSNEFYFKDGNIIWLKGFNNINSHYLKYLLKSIVNDIKKLAHGSAYSALTIEKLVNVEVNLPDSLNVQEEIVKVLDETASLTDSLISKYLEKLSNLEELRKSILEKAFKGELTN